MSQNKKNKDKNKKILRHCLFKEDKRFFYFKYFCPKHPIRGIYFTVHIDL